MTVEAYEVLRQPPSGCDPIAAVWTVIRDRLADLSSDGPLRECCLGMARLLIARHAQPIDREADRDWHRSAPNEPENSTEPVAHSTVADSRVLDRNGAGTIPNRPAADLPPDESIENGGPRPFHTTTRATAPNEPGASTQPVSIPELDSEPNPSPDRSSAEPMPRSLRIPDATQSLNPTARGLLPKEIQFARTTPNQTRPPAPNEPEKSPKPVVNSRVTSERNPEPIRARTGQRRC